MIRSVLGLLLICSFSVHAAQTAKGTKVAKATTPAAKATTPPPKSIATQEAAGYYSEFFYQAAENQSWLAPRLEYANTQAKYKNNSAKLDVNSTVFAIEYERGWAPTFSSGATMKYTSGTSKSTDDTGTNKKTETSGLNDLEFFFKGYSVLDEGQQLWFGATLSISPGDAERKSTSASKSKINGYSGGKKIAPYIGYSKKLTAWTIGAKLSTELRLGSATLKATDTSGNSAKADVTGGETSVLYFFAESPMGSGIGGVNLAYSATKSTDISGNNTTTTFQGGNILALGLYGTQSMSETCLLKGELLYGQVVSDVSSDGGLKSNSVIGIAASARFMF